MWLDKVQTENNALLALLYTDPNVEKLYLNIHIGVVFCYAALVMTFWAQ